jgi:pilus assembly protein CpaB
MRRSKGLKTRNNRWQMLTIIVASIVAAVAIFSYTSSVANGARNNQTLVNVYLAQKTIPIGTTLEVALSDGSIEGSEFPLSARPIGAISTMDDGNKNLVTTQSIQPGQVIVESLFSVKAPKTGALEIPDGSLAVTVSVGDPGKVASFLQPGSEVTIFVTGALASMGDGSESTQVLLPRVTILAIGDQVESASNTSAPNSSTLFTLSVTPSQAKKLIFASQNLSLHFGLRTNGVEFSGSPAITNKNLISEF